MRLSSALIRLCLLYFLVSAEKGQGKSAHLSSSSSYSSSSSSSSSSSTSSSSSSSVTQEKTMANPIGNGSDCASEDVTDVTVRRLMEMADLQQISTTEENLHPSAMEGEGTGEGAGEGTGEGSPAQRLAFVLWSMLRERDQLKKRLQTSEEEVARLKEDISSQLGQCHPRRHRHEDDEDDDDEHGHDDRHRHEGSAKDDTCPSIHEVKTALFQFQKQHNFQFNRLVDSISFIERDLMMIINNNKKQQEEEEKHKAIFKNDTETQINEEDEEKVSEESVVASDCYELFVLGKKKSGVYTIYPQGEDSEGVSVWCDMGEGSHAEGVSVWCDMGEGSHGEGVTAEAGEGSGGWTVILLRRLLPQQVNFTRGWEDYRNGFGTPQSEYWIGNEVLHQLTSPSEGKPQQALRVEMTDYEGVTKDAFYGRFSVGSKGDNFPLDVGLFDINSSSVSGNSLEEHNGQMFTTVDKDNDYWRGNCADEYGGGGFWYSGSCGYVMPNSPILPKFRSGNGLEWYHFNENFDTNLIRLTMKIHPYSG